MRMFPFIVSVSLVLLCFSDELQAQSYPTPGSTVELKWDLPSLIPPESFVTCGPTAGGTSTHPTPITLEEALQLTVQFLREKLPSESGVQFLSIIVTVHNKYGAVQHTVVKHAFTYPQPASEDSEKVLFRKYVREIVPFGFVSERKLRQVTVLNDSVAPWSVIKIEVIPDEDYTKFAERTRFGVEWWYRVKGPQIEEEFFLGIPKVLYDTRSRDTIEYGNASAMLRFYYLHSETGRRFPVNVGFGTFGVHSPIDVSSRGGGFAVSVLFDVVQAARIWYDLSLTEKVNAGIEITPFFPLSKQARILINARIGYSP